MKAYDIIVEKATNNYSAYSPDIPGCVAIGNTEKEAIQNFIEAAEFHLEGIKEDYQ